MRTSRILVLVAFALTMLGAFVYTYAQQSDTTCPVLIDQALNAIGSNCNGLDRNSACYGFNEVSATFTGQTAPDTFSQPSDRAALANLSRIGTSALDVALKQWGIALLSVQANLPDALPGQNAMFMLLGDTEVENAVKPDDAEAADPTIQAITRSPAPLYPSPEVAENPLATIPDNTVVLANALSPTGDWLRVVFGGQTGWVSREMLAPQSDLDALRLINPQAQSPMQSVYLRTTITGTHCTQAPDSLVVQGPKNFKVDINVNGADIRLGSTIALRIIPLTVELANLFRPYYPTVDDVKYLMELVVIDGHVTLDADTSQEVNLGAGYRTYRCLSNTENLGLDTVTNDRQIFPACPWLPPQPWRQTDYDNYNVLEGIPLNYPVNLPPFPPPTLTPTASNTPTRTNTRTPVPFVPSRTPSRTPTPTATCVAYTDVDRLAAEPVYCTATPTPTDTATAAPTNTATNTATNTPTVFMSDTPTNTATNTPLPTDTPTSLPTATDTQPPPTATDTPVPTATDTQPPPTATDTLVPTATDTQPPIP
jgi:hypothetical protein